MKRLIISIGVVCSFLWLFVTQLTRGLPMSWCRTLDQITFHRFNGLIFEMANGFYYDVPNNHMPTGIFLFIFTVIFILVFSIIIVLGKSSSEKGSLGWIIFFSILFRFILWPGEMIHENDIYRYLWDGKVFLHQVNPFQFAPLELSIWDDEIGDEGEGLRTLIHLKNQNPVFFERIGHQQVPTIYPPVAQLIFAFSAWIWADSILLLKLIFILFDLGALWLIVLLLRHLGKDPCYVLVYGWSPLVLKEIANSGHYDAIVVFFMLLGLYFLMKLKKVSAVVSFAFSFLTKFFAAIFLPILHRLLNWKHWGLFFLLLMVSYLPFIFWDQVGFDVFKGLLVYNQQWWYNASIFSIVYALMHRFPFLSLDPLLMSKIVVGILYVAVLFRLSQDQRQDHRSLLHKCFIGVSSLFILNPVGDPWYFCWVMPFLCIFPYRSWLLLSGLLMLSYLNFQGDMLVAQARFYHIPVISFLVYIPFLFVWGWERFFSKEKFV